MLKKIFILFITFFLSNCVMSSSALLGPAFTGARTGSIYHASLSYGTSKMLNTFKELENNTNYKEISSFLSNKKMNNKNPEIQSTYAVDKIIITQVLDPEPLP